jgi:hypothetical protein
LDLAWQWEEAGGVSGDALYDTLERCQKPAWVVITDAISCLARHAYVTDGDRRAIDEVSEEVIDQVVAYAQRAKGF